MLSAAVAEKKVAAGDEIEVAILTKRRVDKLVREAKMVGGSKKPLGRGEAEMGIQLINELTVVQGIDVVGLLPAEPKIPDLAFVASASSLTEQPIAAKALIDFLTGPKAAAAYKAKGQQPG